MGFKKVIGIKLLFVEIQSRDNTEMILSPCLFQVFLTCARIVTSLTQVKLTNWCSIHIFKPWELLYILWFPVKCSQRQMKIKQIVFTDIAVWWTKSNSAVAYCSNIIAAMCAQKGKCFLICFPLSFFFFSSDRAGDIFQLMALCLHNGLSLFCIILYFLCTKMSMWLKKET